MVAIVGSGPAGEETVGGVPLESRRKGLGVVVFQRVTARTPDKDGRRPPAENDRDIIIQLSRPYLQAIVIDQRE
jgi:hypothetical protein